ncbi:hypothetical protein LXT21_20300 [Myxococcus sp. K38C18041901]|uniref:hypothetical protein n=1 Tax=Myxococcus guangdongensis TaxID=2906760 RepID=UPI0020A6F0BB|nr:hypothetical protein [Myxococcus guangdongensis]MCP3061126.1 hypothetical protein [Myxococcus guangdongensis]
MRKLSMTGVLLCGAWVAGCSGAEQEPSELPGEELSRQAASLSLPAALTCIETYVNAGTCDWDHWSDLYDACDVSSHPELDDGHFLEEVQSDNCTVANWPALRAQLLSTTPLVRVFDSCQGGPPLIHEASANGCHALGPNAGASFFEVSIGKSVTLYAGANCAGDSVTVETDANLCETTFASGASADGAVLSYRIQDVTAPASPYRYTCSASEPQCVENDNARLASINKKHTVKVVRVTYPGRTTPSLTTIRNSVRGLYDFFDVASRGQVSLEVVASQTVEVTSAVCKTAKSQAVQKARSNAFLTVYSMPSGMCSTSNAGSRSVYLKGGLFRDYAHEVGHVLGLAHGNTRNPATGEVKHYGDASTFMGSFPSDNYNLPQLHWLGWTKKEELQKVNSVVDNGGTVLVKLRPVGGNTELTSAQGDHRLGAVWDIPGTDQRLFIAVPKPRFNDVNQIEGGTVMVYRAPRCVGCMGMSMGTTVISRFIATNQNEHEAQGLFIKPVAYERTAIQSGGNTVHVYSSVTVSIRR